MTKLFKDATAGELHEMAKGLRAHIIDGLGFAKAEIDVQISDDRFYICARYDDDPKGNLYTGKETKNWFHPAPLDPFDNVVEEIWARVNKCEPADKRHLKAMMRQLGDTLEASEAFQSASVEAFRARIRAMRDDMGARLIKGPKS